MLTDHVHAECRGIDCKSSEKYTFSFTRKIHRAFMKSTHDNIDKVVPICTASRENTYELFSSCCSDLSCICVAHSAELTAATNITARSFAAAFCCRTMRNSDRPPTPDRKRRHTFANTRQPIPRATTGAPQLQNKVTFNQLFSPSTGIRPRQSVGFCSRGNNNQWSSPSYAALP